MGILGEIGKGLLNFTAEAVSGSKVSNTYHIFESDREELVKFLLKWNEIFQRKEFFENLNPSVSNLTLPPFFNVDDKNLLASNGTKNIFYYFDREQYYFKYHPTEDKELKFSFSLLNPSAFRGKFNGHGILDGAGNRGHLAGYLELSVKDGDNCANVCADLMEVSGWVPSKDPLRVFLDKINLSEVYDNLQSFIALPKHFEEQKEEEAKEEQRKQEEAEANRLAEETRKKKEEELKQDMEREAKRNSAINSLDSF